MSRRNHRHAFTVVDHRAAAGSATTSGQPADGDDGIADHAVAEDVGAASGCADAPAPMSERELRRLSAARRAAATTCGWCAGPIAPRRRGRIPRWCSASCRQRAWEQSRAAASGLSAVRIVERVAQLPVPAPPRPSYTPAYAHQPETGVDTGTRTPRPGGPVVPLEPAVVAVLQAEAEREGRLDAADRRTRQLRAIAEDLDRGRVYDRDLHDIALALSAVLDAFGRRTGRG